MKIETLETLELDTKVGVLRVNGVEKSNVHLIKLNLQDGKYSLMISRDEMYEGRVAYKDQPPVV